MSAARVHLMADGHVHRVKVRARFKAPVKQSRTRGAQVAYLPYLAEAYLDNFTVTPHAVSLGAVVDFGESRRLGTLVVWLDEGIADDTPIIAVPINLAVRSKARELCQNNLTISCALRRHC